MDDDLSVRESLPQLLRQCSFAATAFASADDFLASSVVVLDLEAARAEREGPANTRRFTNPRSRPRRKRDAEGPAARCRSAT